MRAYELDRIDRQLLDLLQRDASQSLDALSGKVALSAPAIQRRIKRMRDCNVIVRDTIEINPAAVGLPMTFIVIVELILENSDQITAFTRKAVKEDLVEQCYYVTGEGDFVLIVLAQDMSDFEALTKRLLFSDPNVRRFKTLVVMGKSYRSLGVSCTHVHRGHGTMPPDTATS